jgi:hypothetical protein
LQFGGEVIGPYNSKRRTFPYKYPYLLFLKQYDCSSALHCKYLAHRTAIRSAALNAKKQNPAAISGGSERKKLVDRKSHPLTFATFAFYDDWLSSAFCACACSSSNDASFSSYP